MRVTFVTFVAAVLLASGLAAADRPHVYLVVVGGLDARFAPSERMPKLFEVLRRPDEHASQLTAIAIMPTRTNPNHVSLLSGVFPDVHGVTGNAYWSRKPGKDAEKVDKPELIEVETLF